MFAMHTSNIRPRYDLCGLVVRAVWSRTGQPSYFGHATFHGWVLRLSYLYTCNHAKFYLLFLTRIYGHDFSRKTLQKSTVPDILV